MNRSPDSLINDKDIWISMDFKPNKKKMIISLGAALFVYLFIAFIMRCFPLGCEWWEPREFLIIARDVPIPAFFIAYLFLSLIKKKK
ncbi:hypothetical protein COV19_03130 [Candidatus Woesearchaeota archaeon CG10_big_fil_rev_8_21_14_0_10_44_13]|nr:MAG: hypothetical protein COV19_03130 [Candidatus Woesearchaeota archaeon CG10_big_fil_rev_8_21_14_0_10_44_13]